MTEDHPGNLENEIQPKQISSTLEWGHWFLWLLASITAGGIAISEVILGCPYGNCSDDLELTFFSFLGGIIGAIAVGFMPWLAQKRKITIFVWGLCIFISTALIVIALAIIYTDRFSTFYGYQVGRFIPTAIGSFLIALVTRGICKQRLKS
ncbi:hypothetical protein ACFLZW_05815, partial [Chloroflexota bacterium]